MALSAAVSVASFSVVLAESFAAVAASSLVPATFVSLARAAKGATSTTPDGNALIEKNLGGNAFTKALAEASKNVKDIDLLVPKAAKITGDFEFEARDGVSVGGSVGAALNVVTVAVGFSALYESKSRNRIHLEVDYVAVNYPL